MATGQKKVDIYLKKFLPQQQMRDNFLDYLRQQDVENLTLQYPNQGFFFGNSMIGSGPDEITAATPSLATDGQGNLLKLDPTDAVATFENALATTYYVGMRYNILECGTEVNVRTGQIEYTFLEDAIGEKGEPTAVIDNGSTLTVNVDSIFEAGVSHAGRRVKVYLKRAVGQADAFFEGIVYWDGSNNLVDTTHLIGQTAGLVSVDPADYWVFAPGLTIRTTDLSIDPIYVFYGTVTGGGAGTTPTAGQIDNSGATVLYGGGAFSTLVDLARAFLVGGGDITWDINTGQLAWSADLRLKPASRPFDYQMVAGSVTLADGECFYIDADGMTGGVKAPTVALLEDVPDQPEAQPIALRIGNDVYFRDGALELKGDTDEATVTTGRLDGSTEDTLNYLGAKSESDATPDYGNATGSAKTNQVVVDDRSLTRSIKDLDLRGDIVNKVKALSLNDTSLPTTIPMVIAEQTINVGDKVLFVRSGLNGIYQLTDDNGGLGPAVWTKQDAFNGVQTPENLSLVGVMAGDEDFIETVYQYTSGRGWRPLDTAEIVGEPTGFRDRTNSTFSFTPGTRTFEIQPLAPATKYYYTQKGKLFRKTGTDSVVIPDVEGLHYIYFDDDTLVSTQVFNMDIILGKTFVSTVYWNQVDQEASLVADERHGLTMDGPTHAYLHTTNGMQFASGLGITQPTSGDGSLDADAQADMDGGVVYDEDLLHTIVHSDTPSNFYEQDLQGPGQFPVYYKVGATGYWKRDAATNFPLKAGTLRPQWNDPAGPWTLQDASADGKFIAMYFIATNDVNQPIIVVMGQREDDSLALAQQNNTIDGLNLDGLPTLEFKSLYRVIYEADSTYANGIKARAVDVVDLRFSQGTGGTGGIAPTDHNALAGRSDSGAHPSQSISTTPGDLGGAADEQTTLDQKQFNKALDDHFKALRILEHPTNKQRVIVTGATVTLDSGVVLEQQNKNLVVNHPQIEIDFQTGEIFESDGTTPFNGGANDFSPVIPPLGENRWAGLTLLPSTVNADNTINLQPLVLISDSDNFRGVFASGIKIGQVRLEENTGQVADILESTGAITRQGVGGSGDGGTGDANSFLESLKDRARLAFWKFFTPNIFSQVEDTEEDTVNTTASFDIANSEYDIDDGEKLRTINQLGSRFLGSSVTIKPEADQDLTKTELWALFNNVPAVGSGSFSPIEQLNEATNVNMNINNPGDDVVAQTFTPVTDFTLTSIELDLRQVASPTGNLTLQIWGTNSGDPDNTNVLTQSDPIDVTTLETASGGDKVTFVFSTPIVLSAGTLYAMVMDGPAQLTGPSQIQIGSASSNLYTDGTYTTSPTGAPASWTPLTLDIYFRILGTAVTPEAFTTRVSRDGQEFQEMTMVQHGCSNLYKGEHIFTDEAANATLHELAEADADSVVPFTDTGAGYKRAIQFVVANKEAQKELTLYLNKVGSPIGKASINIYKDDGGLPSTNPTERIGGSQSGDDIDIAAMAAGNVSFVIPLGRIVTKPGTYWIEIVPDAAYRGSYVASTDELNLRIDTAGSDPDSAAFDEVAGTWAATAGQAGVYKLDGMLFDLRYEIDSNVDELSLQAAAIFYGSKAAVTPQGLKLRHVERFDGADNLNVFEVPESKFLPDPDLCQVLDVYTGRVFKFPAFGLDGQRFTFPEDFFLDPGREVLLYFEQNMGSSFNNADAMMALLAANRLGSTDQNLDKSIAGEGIMLRADNNKLIEISVREKLGGGYELVFAEVN